MKYRKAVVTACNVPFVPGAFTLLYNFQRLMPQVARYCFVPQHEWREVNKIIGNMAEVLPIPRPIDGVPADSQIAVAKVFTPLVDAEIAVWIDCDCILCRPAPELWDVPAGRVRAVRDNALRIGDTLAMAPDVMKMMERMFPGILAQRGINGGLFSLRSEEWSDLPERYEKVLREGALSVYHTGLDQPILSAMMLPMMEWLPYEFNAHHLFDYSIPLSARIIHYTSPSKPWMASYPKHEPAYFYWVKYGLGETRWRILLSVLFKIILRSPRRLLMRRIRSAGLVFKRSG